MRRAFALGESLLGFSLISLVLILLLNLFPSSLATVRRSEQRFKALTLADNRLEQQAAEKFSSLVGLQEVQEGDFKVRRGVGHHRRGSELAEELAGDGLVDRSGPTAPGGARAANPPPGSSALGDNLTLLQNF